MTWDSHMELKHIRQAQVHALNAMLENTLAPQVKVFILYQRIVYVNHRIGVTVTDSNKM